MTDTESYNGWKNRETWAFNLHWQNDQGLYGMVLEAAGDYIANGNEDDRSDYRVGEMVVEYVMSDLPELSPELWEMMRSDVGSFWRIDHTETGRCVRESLDNES